MKPVEIPLRYRRPQLAARVPKASLVGVIRPHPAETPGDVEEILREALAHSPGTPPQRALVSAGDRIAIILYFGLHRPTMEAECGSALSKRIVDRDRVITHDAADIVPMGTTRCGKPGELFRNPVATDVRIALDSVEFHNHAGFLTLRH